MAPSNPEELKVLKIIDSIADEFEQELNAGRRPRIEPLLRRVEPPHVTRLLKELMALELDWRAKSGQTLVANDYLERFPQHRAVVDAAFAEWATKSGAGSSGTVNERDTQSAHEAVEAGNQQKRPILPPVPDAPSAGSGRFKIPGRFGRFELKQQLGAGSFGAVYLAHDTRLGRDVALKIPHSTQSGDSNRRFLTEARSAAKLKHPSIITIYDSDIVDDSLYIACEFINGGDMAQILKRKQTSLKQLVAWLRDAARALAYAHQQGVIHRDVKPSNLLVSSAKQVYVSDFGLARRVEDNSSLTADGSVLGTPAYMAPEQAAGKTSAVGPASDQYSVGVMLYEVLTGRVPFRGNIPQILQKVVKEQPKPPSELNSQVPADLEAVCLKALAKNPAHRYPDLNAFADDLDCWLHGKPVSVRPDPKPGLKEWFRNAKTVHLFASALLLALVIILGIYVATTGTEPSPNTAQNGGPGGEGTNVATNTASNDGDQSHNTVNQQRASAQQPGTSEDEEQNLQRQRDDLLSAVRPIQSFECRLPTPNGSTRRVQATFLENERDAELPLLLFTDPDDPTRKSLWRGGLRLLQTGGTLVANSTRWSVALSRLAGETSYPSELSEIVLTSNNGTLIWINLPEQAELIKLRQPLDLPTVAELRTVVQQSSTPGRVWEGILQEPNQAARRVRLTFTESRDDGQHVRAVLESIDSGFIMSPFLGTIDWSPAALIAGQPIRLVRQARAMGAAEEWEIFRAPWLNPEIQVALTDDGMLIGTAGNAQLKLSASESIEGFLPLDEQWRQALAPGSIWSGVMRLRDEPPTRVNLTIAEEREGFGYVRLLFEGADNPHLFAVYEGAVNFGDAVVDGFACTMDIAVYSPQHISGRNHGLFGGWRELRHAIRIVPDGQTLLMRTAEGEEITFTRQVESALLPLDRTNFVDTWTRALQAQTAYEGVLTNTQFDVSTRVRLDVLSAPDVLGNVSVRLSEVDRPRIRMEFDGTLRSDSDEDVNAFALKLNKTDVGQGNSMIFGQAQNVELFLRLAPDGKTLIGMAGVNRNWIEIIKLDAVQ